MGIFVQGLDSLEGTYGGAGTRGFKVTYKSIADKPPHIITDLQISEAVAILTGIRIGSPWPNDVTSYCKTIRSKCVRRRDKPVPVWDWQTDIDFVSSDTGAGSSPSPASPSGGAGPEGFTPEKDPTKRLPRISVVVDKYEEPVTADIVGVAPKNSAGQPVVRMKKRARVIFHWSRIVSKWKWEYAQEPPSGYLYSRNLIEWSPVGTYKKLLGDTKIPARQARIEDIKTELLFDNGGCVKVDMEIHTDANQFNDIFLDQGFFQLRVPDDPASGLNRIVDTNGFTAQASLLDGHGQKLAAGLAAKTITAQYYQTKDWSVAPLGGPGGFFS